MKNTKVLNGRSIKITDEAYKIIDTIAHNEMRSRKTILSQAVKTYGRLKKII